MAAATTVKVNDALDEFELEGVGNNIPFLAAVMGQERFRSGRLTTGYIAEEFPNGFSGVELDPESLTHLAALACCSAFALETRDGRTLNDAEQKRSVLIGDSRWDFAFHSKVDHFRMENSHRSRFQMLVQARSTQSASYLVPLVVNYGGSSSWSESHQLLIAVDATGVGHRDFHEYGQRSDDFPAIAISKRLAEVKPEAKSTSRNIRAVKA